jgi:FkbM family methyltransferase
MTPIQDCATIDHGAPWGRHAPARWRGASLAVAHTVPAGWGLAERLVKLFRRPIKYAGQACYDVGVWGLKLRLAAGGNRSELKLLYGPQLFDPDERRFVASRLPPGGTFVDIGANAGAYTYWACHCLQGRGRVLAFEPDVEMRARLAFNLRTNTLALVDLCEVALSDQAGTAVLYVNQAQRGQNTLESEQAAGASGDRVELAVALDTLWSQLQQRRVDRIDVLKIDIEGHELPVLRHFFAHAPESCWPGALLTEHKPGTKNSLEQLLRARGYRQVFETALNRGYVR